MYCIFMWLVLSISIETHEIVEPRLMKLAEKEKADVAYVDVFIA
jgi:hypothetical protein